MTAREYSTHEHPQPDILSSGERRSTSTTSSKSPPPAVNMRSPSPRVAFTATAITTDSKGVKTITRKVIRRLEELGHPSELLQMDGDLVEEIDEQIEVERVLNEDRTGKVGTSSPNKSQQRRQSKQHLNGTATPRAMKTPPSSSQKDLANGKGLQKKEKVDWEIPRKLLHSSIGMKINFTPSQMRCLLVDVLLAFPPDPLSLFLGLLVSYLYLCDADLSLVTFTLWAALCVIVPADVLRLNYPPFAHIYERMLGFLMRESEKVRPLVLTRSLPIRTRSHAAFIPLAYNERSDMVHPRGQFRVIVLSQRCGCGIHSHVRLHFTLNPRGFAYRLMPNLL